MTDETPPPGTEEAIEAGCRCPTLDNPYHGIEGLYIYTKGCPIHPWDEVENDD